MTALPSKKNFDAKFVMLAPKERSVLLIRAAMPDTWNIRPVGWLIEELLARRVDPNTACNGNDTYPYPRGIPLVHALMQGMKPGKNDRRIERAVMSFVAAGVSVGRSKVSGRTLLHEAAAHGSVELLAVLIRRGTNFEERDKKGETALFHAARSDNPQAVKLLIAAGATNARNKKGETAHDIAIAQGSKKTAALLAKVFPTEQRLLGGALSKQDVARLLQRLAKDRHSIYSPSGKPDPALAKVLTGGRIQNTRVHLHLDTKRLPAVSPSIKKELLVALGHEGLRWLNTSKVDTRGYDVGAAKPWYMTDAKSLKRAAKLVAQISGHRN